MSLDKIRELRELCLESHSTPYSLTFKLLIEISEYLLSNNESNKHKKKQVPVGWLSPQEFVKKYPICHSSEVSKLNRYSDDLDIHFKKIGRCLYCDPNQVLIFLMKNKKKFPKLYNRMKERNFFGLELNESDIF